MTKTTTTPKKVTKTKTAMRRLPSYPYRPDLTPRDPNYSEMVNDLATLTEYELSKSCRTTPKGIRIDAADMSGGADTEFERAMKLEPGHWARRGPIQSAVYCMDMGLCLYAAASALENGTTLREEIALALEARASLPSASVH